MIQQMQHKQPGTTLKIKSIKAYVAVVTFSINDNISFLENLKQGLKRTLSRNK